MRTFAAALWRRGLTPLPGRYWGSLRPTGSPNSAPRSRFSVPRACSVRVSPERGGPAEPGNDRPGPGRGRARQRRARRNSTEVLGRSMPPGRLVGARVTVLQADTSRCRPPRRWVAFAGPGGPWTWPRSTGELAAGNPAAYQATCPMPLTSWGRKWRPCEASRDQAWPLPRERRHRTRGGRPGRAAGVRFRAGEALENLAVSYRAKGRRQEAVAVIEGPVAMAGGGPRRQARSLRLRPGQGAEQPGGQLPGRGEARGERGGRRTGDGALPGTGRG